MELDPCDSDAIIKTYVYANSQPLMQYDGDMGDSRYFYLHDRLGNVRALIDIAGDVNNRYTYEPYGNDLTAEIEETIDNSFKFTGQYYDEEIAQYYLRARQYDVYAARFSTRDPAVGKFKEPLTLHRYLYCVNDPVNRTDPNGEIFTLIGLALGNAIGDGLRLTNYATYGNAAAWAFTSIGAVLDIYLFGPTIMKAVRGVKDDITGMPVTDDPCDNAEWDLEEFLDAYDQQKQDEFNAPN